MVEAEYSAIKAGRVQNPNIPSLCNIGYVGKGCWEPRKNGIITKEYKTWSNMIERCYSEKIQENPSYKNCIVDERWHCFQNFCEDIKELENYQQWKNNEGWELDKDIKINGNKIYNKNNCMFVLKVENVNEMNRRTIKNKLTGLVYIGISPTNKKYEFTNQHEFAKLYGLNSGHVNNCLKGRLKSHKKWTFKIKENEEEI